jgi:hypothetical protein
VADGSVGVGSVGVRIAPCLGPFGGWVGSVAPGGYAAYALGPSPGTHARDALVGPLWIPWAWGWARTVVPMVRSMPTIQHLWFLLAQVEPLWFWV